MLNADRLEITRDDKGLFALLTLPELVYNVFTFGHEAFLVTNCLS